MEKLILLKKHVIIYIIACILMVPTSTCGQALDSHIETISSALETVEASKLEYSQNLKLSTTNYVTYTVTSVDSKGKTEVIDYNFSFADIDINTIRSITKKDVIVVQLLIKGKQKLIKKISNSGEKVSYVDNTFFYAKNIDNGRDLVGAIKDIIPINETLEKNKLALNSYIDHQNWIIDNVQDVEYTKTQFVQKIDPSDTNNGHLKVNTTINSKSKTTTYEYEFNLATLNPNSLIFKINSDEFYIEANSRRNIKTIKVFKNGVQESFTNKVRFYSGSIENGKDIYKVLKQIIPIAEEAFSNSKPNISSTASAYQYLNGIIKNISTNDNTIVQSIDGDCVTKIIVQETNPKETINNEYNFNFNDINLDNIDFNTNKTRLYIEVNTRKKADFIRHVKNDELQNYTNDFKLYVNSIEDAMLAKEALQNITKNCELSKVKTDFNSITSGLEALKNEVTLVKIGDDNYDQSLETVNTSPYVLKITSVFSNLKSSKETIYEFGLGDINSKNISIATSGKKVMVEINTKHLEKIIKTYQDGSIKSYAYKIAIQATDIENARRIVNILKNITLKLE
ncbi:hypothetical protein [uncultured Algibacter sp.]|uniref:hypothetical protein n=1 Tax=uncultured Algibacter sp. TaxID=298659 RepID=UPI002624ED9D|nr:hypothetical protein [uncultured Algibacter sp.]